MMKREMPVRHWRTLPEASMIDELLATSAERVETMLRHQPASAAPFVPSGAPDLAALRAAAQACAGCQLCTAATQVVFGTGPADAQIVFVGEQPGDQEDQVGLPFIGPAGQLLDTALAAAGLERSTLYLTNAVKHFKHRQVGKQRLHQRPEARDVAACKPWLTAELQLIRPALLVCLGRTAAHAVLGRVVRLNDERGRWQASGWTPRTLVTTHPAAILRTQDPAERAVAMAQFVADLQLVAAARDELNLN